MSRVKGAAFCSILAIGCSGPPDGTAEAIAVKADKEIIAAWWLGDGSQCSWIEADANRYIDGHTYNVERGVETGTGYGHPGCEHAYITDYWMPDPHNNHLWGWFHVAARPSESVNNDRWTCEQTWTNLRVWWWVLDNHNTWHDNGLRLASSRKGTWTGSGCDLNFPDNLHMWTPAGTPTDYSVQSVYRAVSQRGLGFAAGENHYSYMVTNPGERGL
jgi:hypothetical protein